MRIWIITALVVLVLACLAATAGWWMPELLGSVTSDVILIQRVTNAARVILWLSAAVAGAVGAQRALGESESKLRKEEATSGSDVAGAGQTGNERLSSGSQAISTGEEPNLDDDLVTVFTAGGVRIIAESSRVELEKGQVWPTPSDKPRGNGNERQPKVPETAATPMPAVSESSKNPAEASPVLEPAALLPVAGLAVPLAEDAPGESPAEPPAGDDPTEPLPIAGLAEAPVEDVPMEDPAGPPPVVGPGVPPGEVPPKPPPVVGLGVLPPVAVLEPSSGPAEPSVEERPEPPVQTPVKPSSEGRDIAPGPTGLPAANPLPTPIITTPFNLPADLSDFTGRGREVSGLHRRLSQNGPAPRTIAISSIAGMGGVGKTSLALHAAHNLAAEGLFSDVQLYIDLKGTEPHPLEPAAALNTLLTPLLGPDPERPEDLEALSELWRTALQDKEALLVLDNAASADQVRPLLPGWPTCAVLITSRQRFSLPGAELLDLDRLKPEDARALLQRLAPRLDTVEANGIAELCGGLPLALRIAGNYLALNDNIAAGVYAARLADEQERLVHLSNPEDPGQNVAATLSLSVAQLPAGTHWAWTLLSLLPAPFDAQAAAALWGDGVAQDAWAPLGRQTTLVWLRSLRNRSLVGYNPQTDRYHLHDLLRLAASRELDGSGRDRGARKRLVFHFLDQVQAMTREQRYLDLDPDWPQLQVALECARQDVGLFSELVLALNDYWSARGMARERAEWSEQAAQACAAARLRQEQGAHLGNLGRAYADRGSARRAIEYYGQALTLSRRNGDRRGEGALLGNMGQAYAALSEAQQAIYQYEQALEIAVTSGDRRREGVHLGNLGRAWADLGEPRKAVDYQTQALTIAQELNDQRQEATHLSNLGLAYADLGDLHQAVECQKQALAMYRKVGDLRGEADALDNLGRAYAEMGQPKRAIDYYEQALEIDQAIGNRRGEGADLGNLGRAFADLGDAKRAIGFYKQALKIAREIGDRRNEGASLGSLGRAYMDLGDIPRAMGSYQQALQIASQIGDRRSEAAWLGSLGQAHGQMGDIQQAMDYHEQALSIYQEIGDRRGEGNHLASLGRLAQLDGDHDRARSAWTDALRTFEATKDPSAGRVYDWLAELEQEPQLSP